MSGADEEQHKFVSDVGVEAWRHIAARMKELADIGPTDRIILELSAVAVCLANTLYPAVAAAKSRAAAADQLLARVTAEARMFLEPVIAEQSDGKL